MEAAANISSMLSLEPLIAVAQYFASLPVYPVFSTVHFILTAVALRNEPGGVQFAQLHPIASCVMTFIVANSGGILANLALGTPLIQCILDIKIVATCVLAWYLVFFSPFDICYALCHFVPINLTMWVIKELYRTKQIYSGLNMAMSVYPDSLLAVTVVAMFKGSGKQWGITWYHLVFNRQSACKHELLGISYVTKSAFLFSLLLAYNHTHSLMDPALLVLLGGCVLVGMKLWSLQVRSIDPFMTPQGFAWQLLTCLSVTHPHREVGIMTKEKGGVNVGSQNSESTREDSTTPEKHLKHD